MYYKKRGEEKTWLFVHREQALPAKTPAEFNYSLSDADGNIVSIAEKDFLSDYVAALPQTRLVAAEAIKETLINIRAHSTIRFVALPFFLGAFALLGKAFYEDLPDPNIVVVLAGVGLAIIAVVFETVLSRNLIAWWSAIAAELRGTTGPWWIIGAHRNGGALWFARLVLFLPYPTALAFWIYQLANEFGSFDCVLGFCGPRVHGATAWVLAVAALVVCIAVASIVWARTRGQAGWYAAAPTLDGGKRA